MFVNVCIYIDSTQKITSINNLRIKCLFLFLTSVRNDDKESKDGRAVWRRDRGYGGLCTGLQGAAGACVRQRCHGDGRASLLELAASSAG